LKSYIWYRDIVDKLLWKHNTTHEEVEEVFQNQPKFKLIEKGKVMSTFTNFLHVVLRPTYRYYMH